MAIEVVDRINEQINSGNNFLLSGGAGSGKTYTLMQILDLIYDSNPLANIACITFTNVAADEIKHRAKYDKLHVSTIHDFLWDCIKYYQKELKIKLLEIIEEKLSKEQEKLDGFTARAIIGREKSEKQISKYQDAIENLNTQNVKISYENYPKYIDGKFSHDELIIIAEKIFSSYPKIRKITKDFYPIILVDEYQDTQKETVEILLNYLLGNDNFIVGFFGDKMQQIYDTGIGEIPNIYNLKLIKKMENFRSSKEVIELLNKLRTDIQQYQPEKNKRVGSIAFYYIKNPDDFSIENILKNNLLGKWNVASIDNIKILYLTHRYIAKENQYEDLLGHYSRANKRDCLIDNENNRTFCPYADFLYDLESLTDLFATNKIQQLLKKTLFKVDSFKAKKKLYDNMQELSVIKNTQSIGKLIEFAVSKNLLPKSEQMKNYDFEDEKKKEFYEKLIEIEYSQFIRLYKVQQDNTSFSTKHNTKGDEFNNVFVVIDDDAWKQKYNFNNYFSNNKENEDRFKRTNNLFYVVSSRAKKNLAVVCVSTLSDIAKTQVKEWFGEDNYCEIN